MEGERVVQKDREGVEKDREGRRGREWSRERQRGE